MLTVNDEFLDSLSQVAGLRPELAEGNSQADGFNATACLNCGTCTALCPLETHLLPRLLFRYVVMGARDRVLEHASSIYSCLLCKMCEDNCPAGVHITGNIRTLRTYLNQELFRL